MAHRNGWASPVPFEKMRLMDWDVLEFCWRTDERVDANDDVGIEALIEMRERVLSQL